MNPRLPEAGRLRLAVGLTVVGAALLICGVLLALAGQAMELTSPGGWQALVSAGEVMASLGLAFGLGMVFVLAADVPRLRWRDEHAARRGNAVKREHAAQRERASKRRQDVDAEDWLSTLRPAGAEHVPETEREVPGYADDGWHPEEVSAASGDPRPDYLAQALPASEPPPQHV